MTVTELRTDEPVGTAITTTGSAKGSPTRVPADRYTSPEFVSAEVPLSIKELLGRTGTLPEEIAHFVPHQANGVLLARLAKDMGLTGARLHTTNGLGHRSVLRDREVIQQILDFLRPRAEQ